MRRFRTLEDVLHAVGNALAIISCESQYLIGRAADPARCRELSTILEEAEKAAGLLSLVPKEVAEARLGLTEAQDPPLRVRPPEAAGHGQA